MRYMSYLVISQWVGWFCKGFSVYLGCSRGALIDGLMLDVGRAAWRPDRLLSFRSADNLLLPLTVGSAAIVATMRYGLLQVMLYYIDD